MSDEPRLGKLPWTYTDAAPGYFEILDAAGERLGGVWGIEVATQITDVSIELAARGDEEAFFCHVPAHPTPPGDLIGSLPWTSAKRKESGMAESFEIFDANGNRLGWVCDIVAACHLTSASRALKSRGHHVARFVPGPLIDAECEPVGNGGPT